MSDRVLCQFREKGKDHFVTDCSMPTYGQAVRYCTRIFHALDEVAEAQIWYDGVAIWRMKDGEIPGMTTIDLNPSESEREEESS